MLLFGRFTPPPSCLSAHTLLNYWTTNCCSTPPSFFFLSSEPQNCGQFINRYLGKCSLHLFHYGSPVSNSWRFAALHPSLSWRSAISPSSLRNAFSHSELCSQPCIYLNVSSCLSLFNPLMALLPLQPLCSILQLLRRKRS